MQKALHLRTTVQPGARWSLSTWSWSSRVPTFRKLSLRAQRGNLAG